MPKELTNGRLSVRVSRLHITSTGAFGVWKREAFAAGQYNMVSSHAVKEWSLTNINSTEEKWCLNRGRSKCF